MKKRSKILSVILLTIAGLISLSANAQLFLTIDPSYFKVGAMYNHRFEGFGVYGRALYGDIVAKDFYTENIKVATGASIQAETIFGYCSDTDGQLFLGLNSNHFFHTFDQSPDVNLAAVYSISFEFGASITLGRVTLVTITDPLNWETSIGLSFRLSKQDRRRRLPVPCW